MKNIIVIDNFYQNPEAVRNYALNKVTYLAKESLPENFPGTESKQSFYSPGVIQKMEQAIGEKIIVDPTQFAFGVFGKTQASDQKSKTVHVDNSDWTAILYLSQPKDCRGGTAFYECKNSGWNAIPDLKTLNENGFESVEHYKKDFLSPMDQEFSNWKVSTKVGMKFNRMVIFRAGSLFHAADGYFGDSDENCRLLQLFFFRTQKEA